MSSTELQEMGKKRKDSGSSDSSRHSSKHSSEKNKGDHDTYEETDDPEVRFIQANNAADVRLEVGAPKVEFNGLSKDELMKYAKDPFWKKVRWVLFILFWVLWAGMLIAAILIIVLTPKCPKIPDQTFWEKSPGYHIDVSNFKDTDGDGIGDLKGVVEKIDYLKGRGGFLVLSSVLAGSLGSSTLRSTAVTDFYNVDNGVGDLNDIKLLMKKCRQKSLKVVLSFPPHTGRTHDWFKMASKGHKAYQDYYLWSGTSKTSPLVNRVGSPVWNKEGSAVYWSSFHESLPALNLNNTAVLEQLSDAVKFWLNQGFDGIFIDDAAFLAPEVETASAGTGLSIPAALPTTGLTKWYKTGHDGQLYTKGSVRFIQEVRKWVDQVQKKTDRERLLLVSAGNTGLEQELEKTLAYLGDSSTPGAHSVLLYDLIPSKGAKVVKSSSTTSLKESVDVMIKTKKSITTVTQTMAGPRVVNLITSCMNLLIPTTSLTLYGEEVLTTGYGKDLPATNTYPTPYWYLTNAAMINDKYIDDYVDSYDVPMQWTVEGGFSAGNITSDKTFKDQNVMSLSTVGRGQTELDVFDKLVLLRKEHSLNWGTLEWFEVDEKKKPNQYIFSRSAKGFPKFIVVMIKASGEKGGRARNLSKICKKAVPVLSFPSNADFKNDVELSMSNVYFHFSKKGSIYVFKCK